MSSTDLELELLAGEAVFEVGSDEIEDDEDELFMRFDALDFLILFRCFSS